MIYNWCQKIFKKFCHSRAGGNLLGWIPACAGMTKNKKVISQHRLYRLIFIFLIFIPNAYALEDLYRFNNAREQKRFEQLTNELRCLVCQNQNLAESNAALAVDLRNQIYNKIQHDVSDQEIIEYLVERYGDFILYRPPLNTVTFSLWFGPILLLLTSIFYLFYYIHRKKRA